MFYPFIVVCGLYGGMCMLDTELTKDHKGYETREQCEVAVSQMNKRLLNEHMPYKILTPNPENKYLNFGCEVWDEDVFENAREYFKHIWETHGPNRK